jgi:hypothetical protein
MIKTFEQYNNTSDENYVIVTEHVVFHNLLANVHTKNSDEYD